MKGLSNRKRLRASIIPIAAAAGAIVTPSLIMPSVHELRGAGKLVEGTGFGSAVILGLFLGALVGYIVRTALDHSLWWLANEDDRDEPV